MILGKTPYAAELLTAAAAGTGTLAQGGVMGSAPLDDCARAGGARRGLVQRQPFRVEFQDRPG